MGTIGLFMLGSLSRLFLWDAFRFRYPAESIVVVFPACSISGRDRAFATAAPAADPFLVGGVSVQG